MKTNKMMRIAGFLLVAVMLSTCVISGTFAKYTSTTAGTDTARVAKWQFKIDTDDTVVTSKTFTFDLFNTVADTADASETNDANVADATDSKAIIAPGTQGSFEIKLENLSEVSARYGIAFTGDLKNVPVELQITQGNAEVTDNGWKNTIAGINVAIADANKLTYSDGTAGSGNDYVSYTVHWRWVFGDPSNNTSDTTLGLAGTAEPTVTATITVEQVD